MHGNGQNIRCVEVNEKAIKVSSIVNKVLNENIKKIKYRPEDFSVVVNEWFVDGEYIVQNGDLVRIMLIGMVG
ncbi:hypothetical protein Psfp_04185 [Pelotomaculum sp. FP]|uniref:hypothetical protein n=1 Tax=Pelotomaculum sp. FP TaxID=261474 RepID=UPI00110292AE|nr:hypothetical protein [Pelotomaculum sp. FP]TEB10312.1 hypothetical protein Psfp_04185 [Pelotomaculum sp. FP]